MSALPTKKYVVLKHGYYVEDETYKRADCPFVEVELPDFKAMQPDQIIRWAFERAGVVSDLTKLEWVLKEIGIDVKARWKTPDFRDIKSNIDWLRVGGTSFGFDKEGRLIK